MAIPKELKKLFLAGYQLTPESYTFLQSQPNTDEIVEEILKSKPDNIFLELEYIKELLKKKENKEKSLQEPILNNKNKIISNQVQDVKATRNQKLRKQKIEKDLEVIYTPKIKSNQVSVENFQDYFRNRYDKISSFFKSRKDIENVISSSYLSSLEYKESISFIGLIYSKYVTRKGSIILELEDKEGKIKGIITNSKKKLIEQAEYVLEDTVLSFSGTWKGDVLFINKINWPDIPYGRQPNYASEEVFALFISDIHIGSKKFLNKLFMKSIKLLNQELESSKYNRVGSKIKYLFVAGDIVDGVGIYPNQEEDLILNNIKFQYLQASEYFELIDNEIEIIIIPGNHDAARSAEPQTPIQKELATELYELPNIHLLGSPAYIKAHNVEVLMTHGNSIIDINAAITNIENESSVSAMSEMLKNRHVAPIYGNRTSLAPEKEDQLVITRIPDIFHAGHTHITEDGRYKGVTMINSGTFQSQTEYQRSMNINPTPGETFLINLKTLQRTKIDFKKIS